MGNSLNPSAQNLKDLNPSDNTVIKRWDPSLRFIDYDASDPPIIRNDEKNRLEDYFPDNGTATIVTYEGYKPKSREGYPFIVFQTQNQEFVLVERIENVLRICKSSDKDTILSIFGRGEIRPSAPMVVSGAVRDGISVHNLLVYLRGEAQRSDVKSTVFWKECIAGFKSNTAEEEI